jgi:hypothetical protein
VPSIERQKSLLPRPATPPRKNPIGSSSFLFLGLKGLRLPVAAFSRISLTVAWVRVLRDPLAFRPSSTRRSARLGESPGGPSAGFHRRAMAGACYARSRKTDSKGIGVASGQACPVAPSRYAVRDRRALLRVSPEIGRGPTGNRPSLSRLGTRR